VAQPHRVHTHICEKNSRHLAGRTSIARSRAGAAASCTCTTNLVSTSRPAPISGPSPSFGGSTRNSGVIAPASSSRSRGDRPRRGAWRMLLTRALPQMHEWHEPRSDLTTSSVNLSAPPVPVARMCRHSWPRAAFDRRRRPTWLRARAHRSARPSGRSDRVSATLDELSAMACLFDGRLRDRYYRG